MIPNLPQDCEKNRLASHRFEGKPLDQVPRTYLYRMRWASKASKYSHKDNKLTLTTNNQSIEIRIQPMGRVSSILGPISYF